MYGLLLRHIIMIVWASSWILFTPLLPTQKHIGLIKWFNVDTIFYTVCILYIYTNLVLYSQVILTIDHISKRKVLNQSRLLRIHNTWGIGITILLAVWLIYTVKNYKHIRLSQRRRKERLYQKCREQISKLIKDSDKLKYAAQELDQEYDRVNNNYVSSCKKRDQEYIIYKQDCASVKEKYERKHIQLTQAYDALVERENALKQEYTKLKQEYTKLKQESDTLDPKADSKRANCLKKRFTELDQKLKEMEHKFNESEQEFNQLETHYETMQTKIDEITGRLERTFEEVELNAKYLEQRKKLKQEANKLKQYANKLDQEIKNRIEIGERLKQEIKQISL